MSNVPNIDLSSLPRVAMEITPQQIAGWALHTFGTSTLARIATRANSEMAELLREITTCQPMNTTTEDCRRIREEAADVTIILCRLCAEAGGDLWAEVEAKMKVNYERKWVMDGTGHGRHVRETGEAK